MNEEIKICCLCGTEIDVLSGRGVQETFGKKWFYHLTCKYRKVPEVWQDKIPQYLKALELRAKGYGYRRIAKEIGIPKSTLHRMLSQKLRQFE
jgi:DNA invertase Pin-like site-specific DNA recombinase